MRTFLCIPVNPGLRQALAKVSEDLRRSVSVPTAWVRPENLHVTIRFLGEIEPMLTVELETICREITEEILPFDLSIDRLGAFPSSARPRVLWAGGDAPPAFSELSAALNRELGSLGFPEERKETVAHITLARLKGPDDGSVEKAFRALGALPVCALRADRLVLMESVLGPDGSRYTPLFSRAFGGGGAL
jgi:2'-5' RNA ligase